MSWYKIATILEDIQAPSEDAEDIQDVIETLHELELKNHYVKTLPELSVVHPRRKKNVQQIIKNLAWQYFLVCKDFIENVFDDWKSHHRIQGAEDFAEMVIDEYRDYGYRDDHELLEHILKEGLHRGDISIPPDRIKKHVDKEKIEDAIREDFQNEKETYKYQIEKHLNNNFPDWEDSGLDYQEYIDQNNLEDVIEEEIIKNLNHSEYADYVTFDILDLKEAIKKTLYEEYMMTWGGSVESVHDDIDEAVDRMDNVSEEDSVSTMCIAISLALNVMHVNGNIMTCYSDGEINQKFLDYIGSASPRAEEWKDETIEQFFGKKPETETPENVPQIQPVTASLKRTSWYEDVLKQRREYEDKDQWEAYKYFSIGQDEETEKKSYWWVWNGSKLLTKKGPTTHAMAFGAYVNQMDFIKGVYDPVQKLCSIYVPGNKKRKYEKKSILDIPDPVSFALRKKFGEDFKFVVF